MSVESKIENSTVVANEKVNKHIPNDLTFYVLSKLPLKSLKRFECVSKSWALLFENPNFMNMYRNNFISNSPSYCDDTCLLLQEIISPNSIEEHSVMYMLSGERFENIVKIDLPPPFYDYDYDIHILGSDSINGTFCLMQLNKHFLLWNPTTEEFKVIPPSPIDLVLPDLDHFWDKHGFGYDHVRDDYKVIRCVELDPDLTESFSDNLGVVHTLILEDFFDAPSWEIYSLKSNSWKKLDFKLHVRKIDGVRAYMDGMCHWQGGDRGSIMGEYLVSFDLVNEVFITTPIPSYMNFDWYFELVHLMMLNGSIAFISNQRNTAFEISILGELGVKESWIKLFSVDLLPLIERPIKSGIELIFFERKREGEGLSWFNLNTQIFEELEGKGQHVHYHVAIYKKNLLLNVGLIN